MSVWRPTPAAIEPETSMRVWRVYRVEIPALGKGTHHVVGDIGSEGRVSSPIQSFSGGIAVTRSGRRYKLDPDKIGISADAEYVFGIWRRNNNVKETVDVTESYIDKPTE